MNSIKKIAVKTKNHFARNKVAYGMTAVTILVVKGSLSNAKAYETFLVSKGINPLEFWDKETFEALNA